jgi:hypothetical protein
VSTPQQPSQSSGSSREEQAKKVAHIIAAIYAAAEAKIYKILAKLAAKVLKGALLEHLARRRFEQLVRAILADAEAQARRVFTAADRATQDDVRRIMAEDTPAGGAGRAGPPAGGQPPGPPPSPPPPGPTPPPGADDAIRAVQNALGLTEPPSWDSLAVRLHMAGLNALRTTDDVFRDVIAEAMAYHTGIGSKVRDLREPERATESLSRLQVAQKALNLFAERGITAYTDAAGRQWGLAAYVEMATRTAASRMHLMLQLAAMGPPGMDLVIVDGPSAMMSCPLCAPWEGQVLSLGGTETGTAVSVRSAAGLRVDAVVKGTVAEAVAAGLNHPNCRHSLVPFTDGAAVLPVAGGQRGFVNNGRAWQRGVRPDPESPAYKAEQDQRALERLVRKWDARLQVAVTPLAQAKAQARYANAVKELAEHVKAYHLPRRPGRERAGAAR